MSRELQGTTLSDPQLKGEFKDTQDVNCTTGYITHRDGLNSKLNEDNYEQFGETSFVTECTSDDDNEFWTKEYNCISKYICCYNHGRGKYIQNVFEYECEYFTFL